MVSTPSPSVGYMDGQDFSVDVLPEPRRPMNKTNCATSRDSVDTNFVQSLVSWIAPSAHPALQLGAVGMLADIASRSGEHAREIVANGAVPSLVQLLESPNDRVREQ